MGRRPRRSNISIVDTLIVLPWWISVALAVVALPALHFGGGLIMTAGGPSTVLGAVIRKAAVPAALFLLLVAGCAAVYGAYKRHLAVRAETPDGLSQLTWRQFELAVTELLARRGYATEENLSFGPDGGVDVHAWRQSELFIVQCKHWRRRQVGVGPVRELLGVVTSRKAAGGILVSSGGFTPDARDFARTQPIELIDGTQLTQFAAQAEPTPDPRATAASLSAVVPPPAPTPLCPHCRGPMVARTAKRGHYAGDSFWGCQSFPACRGTRPRP